MNLLKKQLNYIGVINDDQKCEVIKKFYLISAAGMPNFGDDMLTRGWVNYIRERHPNCIIYIDAVDPIVACSLYENVICVNYLWHLTQALGLEGRIEDKFADEYIIPKRERLMTQVFENLDSIHLIGGGYINELWDANLRLIELVAYFSQKHNIPAYATGLGLQPLSSQNAEKQIPFIDKFRIFDVRDSESYNVLVQFLPDKISFIGDDFFCFPVSEVARLVNNSAPVLRLCIHDELRNKFDGNGKLLHEIYRIVKKFAEKYPSSPIVFYEFRPGSDGVFYKQIKDKISNVEIISFEKIWKDGLTFSSADYFISTRFHFQLIVSSLGLSGVSYYWSEYYKNKFESLIDVSNWVSRNLDTSDPLDIDQFLTESEIVSKPDFRRVQNEKIILANLIY